MAPYFSPLHTYVPTSLFCTAPTAGLRRPTHHTLCGFDGLLNTTNTMQRKHHASRLHLPAPVLFRNTNCVVQPANRRGTACVAFAITVYILAGASIGTSPCRVYYTAASVANQELPSSDVCARSFWVCTCAVHSVGVCVDALVVHAMG
jgi:hypothetical protein